MDQDHLGFGTKAIHGFGCNGDESTEVQAAHGLIDIGADEVVPVVARRGC